MLRKASAILLSSTLAASASGALPSRQSNPAIGRALLERLPNAANTDQLRFAVPLSLLQKYWEQQAGIGSPAEKNTAPVCAIPERWMAEVDAAHPNATTLTMSVMVFDATLSQPVSIRLLPDTLDYDALLLNGKEFIPYREKGWRVARFIAPGHYKIQTRITVRTGRSGNATTLSFTKQPFAVSTIKFSANRPQEAWIPGIPGRIITNTTDKTSGTLAIGPREQFALHWRTPQPSAVRQGTPSITPNIAWTIGEKVLSASAALDVVTVAGSVDQLRLALPPGADKINVSGGDVRDFRASGSNVEIFFAGRINGRTALSLSFDMPRPKGNELRLPQIGAPQGRILDDGWVLVSNDTGGEMLESSIEGLRPAAPVEAPNQAMGLAAITPTFLYQRTSRNPNALFDLVLTTPFPLVETIADKAEIEIVARPGGEEFTKVTYTMRNNRRQYLRVRMPDGARLMSVKVEGSAAQASREGDVLLVPLPKSIQTLDRLLSFPIEITYCRQGEKLEGRRERKLDLPELVDVPTAIIRATAFLPENARIRATTGTLTQVANLAALDGKGLGYGYGYAAEEPDAPEEESIEVLDGGKNEVKKEADKSSKWGWFSRLPSIASVESAKPVATPVGPEIEVSDALSVTSEDGEIESRKTPVKLSGWAGLFSKQTDTKQVPIVSPNDPSDAPGPISLEETPPIATGTVKATRESATPSPQSGSRTSGLVPTPKTTSDDFGSSLALNYFESGKKAYKENRLEDAEEYLQNATRYGRGQTAQDAKDLLGNVWAIKGGGTEWADSTGTIDKDSDAPVAQKPTDRAYKAKASALRRNVAAQNVEVEQQQEVLIEKGLQLLDSGQEEEGAKVLEEVQKLGTQLKYRGASKVGQRVQEERYESQLGEVQLKIGDNRKLKEQLQTLQTEASQIIMNAPTPAQSRSGIAPPQSSLQPINPFQPPTAPGATVRSEPAPVADARKLALSLEQVAKEEKMDVGEAQSLLFSGISGGGSDGRVGQDQPGFALPGNDQKQKSESIEEENKRLRQQVAVLGKSLDYAKRATVVVGDTLYGDLNNEGLVATGGGMAENDRNKTLSKDDKSESRFFRFIDVGGLMGPETDKKTEQPDNVKSRIAGRPQSGRTVSEDHSAQVRKQIAEVRLRADNLVNQLETSQRSKGKNQGSATLQFDDEIKDIERLSMGYYNAYAGEGETVQRELKDLSERVARGKEIAQQEREKLRASDTVSFSLNDLEDEQFSNNPRAIADFISSNYVNTYNNGKLKTASPAELSGPPDTRAQEGFGNVRDSGGGMVQVDDLVEVTGESLVVSNRAGNFEVVNEALEQLFENDGQVVTVAGRNLDRISVSDTPVLGALLDQKDTLGRKFAVLDEAQYQTLAELNDKQGGQRTRQTAHGLELQGQRDVIVGTSNGILGETFRIADYDSRFNTIDFSGTSLDLATDKYLAIDNGDYITILKTNRAHNWLETGEAPMNLLIEEAAVDIELPRIGQQLLFEKTFLSAGESPDMTIKYNWTGDNGGFTQLLIAFVSHLWK